MVLVCHGILQDHIIKGSCDFTGRGVSKKSYHLASFGDHRHCGSGDLMLLVVEGEDSTCPRTTLLFIFKAHGMLCSHTRNFRM